MHVLVTRPRQDGEETAARLAEMGHQPLLAPLLFLHLRERAAPGLSGIQALLATSANGVKAFVRLSPRRDLPLLAVGPQTAQAGREAGFVHVENAAGGVEELAALTQRLASPDRGALMHIHGLPSKGGLAERLQAAGYSVRSECLYEMRAADRLPQEAAAAISRNEVDAVLFFSPRSAEVFRDCLAREGLGAGRLMALCISEAAARPLSTFGLAEIRVAAQPNQASLLALLD